ncbi:MAG: hypothetical protein JO337_02050 [Acidimicrobiales bacterium]|nr:hypothetical protein [Acidimicrobiales bacterium]
MNARPPPDPPEPALDGTPAWRTCDDAEVGTPVVVVTEFGGLVELGVSVVLPPEPNALQSVLRSWAPAGIGLDTTTIPAITTATITPLRLITPRARLYRR